MALACIDVGTNTTRLLVATEGPDGLEELASERAFTRLGHAAPPGGAIPPAKIAAVARVIVQQARHARELGAEDVVVVGTAALRRATNADALSAAIADRAGLELQVLADAEEARLSFLGATAPEHDLDGSVAVIDVGGGSTELAVGTRAGGVSWWRSFPVGSAAVCETSLVSDPPTSTELGAARAHVAEIIGDLAAPAVAVALAVGGSATSLRRLAGPVLTDERLEGLLGLVASLGSKRAAERLELAPERARLLPGGILILARICAALGAPIRVARGGLREGVLLELLAGGGRRLT